MNKNKSGAGALERTRTREKDRGTRRDAKQSNKDFHDREAHFRYQKPSEMKSERA